MNTPAAKPTRPTSLRPSSLRHPGYTGALAMAIGLISWLPRTQAQLSLTGTSYTQNFDGLASGLPLGWTGRTGASATALGNSASLTTTATDWDNTSGAFKNFAAADAIDPGTSVAFVGTELSATQTAATDRALGIRQTGGTGDPGAAFTLQLGNTVELSNFGLSFKAQMLSVQARSTTWTIQYGLGAVPASWTNLGTFADPAAFGSTDLTFGTAALGGIANQTSNVWIRILALVATTGSGNRDTFGIDDFSLTYTRAPVTLAYWDTNDNTAGTGGNGTWDTLPNNKSWNPAATGDGTAAIYDPSQLAVFAGTPGTVTVSGTVTTDRGLQFDSNGYLLTGGTIALGGALPSITVSKPGQSATIASILSGTAGVAKNGPGTLILSGPNTYTGGTTINAGTVSIASDANLGDATGGLALASGILQSTASLTLSATRTVSGVGTLDVAPGTTLQIAGTVAGLDLTLSNTGSVQFTGASPTLAGLTFQQLATVTTTAASLGLVGNLTTQNTSGTVTLTNDLNLGAVANTVRVINVTNGTAATDLLISGNVTIAGGTGARLSKLGAGTLELAGPANSITGGLRLGEAGLVAVDGGTLRVASPTAFGAGAFQGNAGTLIVLNDMTGANAPAAGVGLSIGANDTLPLTITGSDIEFKGASSLPFISGSTGYQNKLIVNNNVILSGNLSGTGASLGLTIAGPGSFTISSTTNAITNPFTVDQATLVMNGIFSATSKPLTTLQNGATLRGIGTLGNLNAVGGTIAPGKLLGQPTGVLTANDVNLSNASTLSLDIRSKITDASVLQFDQLVANTSLLIDSTVLSGSILVGADIAVGDLFFIVINGSTSSPLGTFFGLADNLLTPAQRTFTGPGGSVTFEIGYRGDLASGLFDASSTNGNDVVLRALTAIPEPGTFTLLAGGLTGLLGLGRMRRKSASR